MSQSDVNRLIDTIKLSFPKDASEISDAMNLLSFAIDGLLANANKQITELHLNKEYDKGMEMMEFSKNISEIQQRINEYSTLINPGQEIEEEDTGEEPDEVEEQRMIPNYSEFVVDPSMPHNLYEDFTYKKVVAFSINNKRYEVKDWKDVLLQTCDLLANQDAGRFLEFLNDPIMKGRKHSYFSQTFVDKKNAKLKNIDVYVWTNLSANSIVKLIRKLLPKFNLKITNYYIYLGADYTPLHKNGKAIDEHVHRQV